MKISKYKEWLGTLPIISWFIFAYNGEDYRVSLQNLTNGSNTGEGTNVTDYCYDIAELPDNERTDFTLRYNYLSGSCKVYLGLRLTPGLDYDFIELGGKIIRFNIPPKEGLQIVVDYLTVDLSTDDRIHTDEFDDTFA